MEIEWEYTLLTEDCLRPRAQVMAVRSNSSDDVARYLSKEPLVRHGGVNPWKIFEMQTEEDTYDQTDMNFNFALDADLHQPYMFLSFSDKGKVHVTSNVSNIDIGSSSNCQNRETDEKRKKKLLLLAEQREKVMDDSLRYHVRAATTNMSMNGKPIKYNRFYSAPITTGNLNASHSAQYIATYNNFSRVCLLSRLFFLEENNGSNSGTSVDSSGQIITGIFNTSRHCRKSAATNIVIADDDYDNSIDDHNYFQYNRSSCDIAGQILIINARSRADALRYLARDPLAQVASAESVAAMKKTAYLINSGSNEEVNSSDDNIEDYKLFEHVVSECEYISTRDS